MNTAPNGRDTSPITFPTVVINNEIFTLKNSMSATRRLAKAGVDVGEIFRLNQQVMAASTESVSKLPSDTEKQQVIAVAMNAGYRLKSLQLELLSAYTAHQFIQSDRTVPSADDWAIALDGQDAAWPEIAGAIWKAFLPAPPPAQPKTETAEAIPTATPIQ